MNAFSFNRTRVECDEFPRWNLPKLSSQLGPFIKMFILEIASTYS